MSNLPGGEVRDRLENPALETETNLRRGSWGTSEIQRDVETEAKVLGRVYIMTTC